MSDVSVPESGSTQVLLPRAAPEKGIVSKVDSYYWLQFSHLSGVPTLSKRKAIEFVNEDGLHAESSSTLSSQAPAPKRFRVDPEAQVCSERHYL